MPENTVHLEHPWRELSIKGSSAEAFLGRMLSNAIATTTEQQAAGAFLLEATGRLISGGLFLRSGNGFIAYVPSAFSQAMIDGLLKYILAEDVQIQETGRDAFFVLDPKADNLPETLYQAEDTALGSTIRTNAISQNDVLVVSPSGLSKADPDDVTRERIQAGKPLFGAELTAESIPLEAGLLNWFDQRKGCYVGQEVIERMWSRARVGKNLCRLTATTLPKQRPLTPQTIKIDGQIMLTSWVQTDEGAIGLGFTSNPDSTQVEIDGLEYTIETLLEL